MKRKKTNLHTNPSQKPKQTVATVIQQNPPKKNNPNSKLLIQHRHRHPSQHPIQHHQLMIKIISPKMKKHPPKERAHSIKSLPSQSYHDRGKSSFARKRRTKTKQNYPSRIASPSLKHKPQQGCAGQNNNNNFYIFFLKTMNEQLTLQKDCSRKRF
jgi:hypothetical protein